MTDAPEKFLIEKRGLYYRPNARGYTGLKSEAGRYSFDEAVERVGPNGPDGPQDGLGMWRESEAPEYSSRCPWDVRMERAAYQRGLEDAAAEIDCGCPQREAVLSAKNKYERARLCGRELCAAEEAAAIRALCVNRGE